MCAMQIQLRQMANTNTCRMPAQATVLLNAEKHTNETGMQMYLSASDHACLSCQCLVQLPSGG